MKKEKLTLLLIDDDPVEGEIFRRHLEELEEWETSFYHLPDINDGLEINMAPDIIFMDYMLGEKTGLTILEKIRSCGFLQPVIMMTGHGNEEVAVEAMKRGVYDYLVKDKVNPLCLHRTISNSLEKYRMECKIKEQEKALLEAERQRVMMESLGAATHHLAQPVTALLCNLEVLYEEPDLEDNQKKILEKCLRFVGEISQIIRKLQTIQKYRTTPYIEDKKIIDIDM